jgi:gamma-glutamylcyclotransferase (GGCT)/AIG2-like uncharacterized protein YtfP
MKNLFAYGTLLVPEIWKAVVGKEFPSEPASLPGYEIRRVVNEDFPGIRPSGDPLGFVEGRVFHSLNEDTLMKLDRYEGNLYDRFEVLLAMPNSASIQSETYVVSPNFQHLLTNEFWNVDWFVNEALEQYLKKLLPS